uniref:Thiamine-monophosphate kinase n=1 Tax=Candidatus Kentrum sp. LPFa TaxID=2126335 RepID=A0A450X7A3_9GAMM|nr:MAG: thiamine-phosphate kinase [Candidatus Kentron sp. LPFa]VFK25187.1 MAG: thiamine-phosphate kinase [Candidatus Kentron sp. LPFa]
MESHATPRYDIASAAMPLPDGMDLAVTVDTLVCGVHFPVDTSPFDIGHKALAVNLSDLAAMGAKPAWAVLSLTLPEMDMAWISAFHRGMAALAERHDLGFPVGDMGIGPLTITIQLHGQVPRGQALRRDGARPGDLIFVTGTLGDAGLALARRFSLQEDPLPTEHQAFIERRLARPTPRVDEGIQLRGIATAAIDISDGVAADLSHITDASGLGAVVEVERLPLSPALRKLPDRTQAWRLALSSGDDYELCFTAPPEQRARLMEAAQRFSCPITRIGHMVERPGVQIIEQTGEVFSPRGGYQHFAGR